MPYGMQLNRSSGLSQCCLASIVPLLITANGHGRRQMCLMDKRGFPRAKPKAKHFPHKFRTGDIIEAVVPASLKNPGKHTGRVSARAKGGLTIYTKKGKVTDIGKRYCQILQRNDGYGYAQGSIPVDAFLSSLSLKA